MRMRIHEVMDVSLNSFFAEYQRNMWERYGLIFVDIGYGSTADGLLQAEEHILSCVNRNLEEGSPFILGVKDLLGLKCYCVDAKGVRFATDDNGEAIYSQAIRYMKYKYKEAYFEKLYEELSNQAELLYSAEDMEELRNTSISEIKDSGTHPKIEELISEAEKIVLAEREVRLLSTIRLVVKNVDSISTTTLNKEGLVEYRPKNVGNLKYEIEKNVLKNLIFKEYAIEKTCDYLAESSDSVLKYETEYLIGGHLQDSDNLEAVINKLLVIRETLNLATLYKDTAKQETINTIAAALSLLLATPKLQKAISVLINLVWAFAESISDIKNLLSGKKVPLIKETKEWVSGFSFVGAEESEAQDKGLRYEDYLRLILFSIDTDKVIDRLMNIIELNVCVMSENDEFRLDNCVDSIDIDAYIYGVKDEQYIISGRKDTEQ